MWMSPLFGSKEVKTSGFPINLIKKECHCTKKLSWNSLDNTESQGDNYHEHASQRSFAARHPFGCQGKSLCWVAFHIYVVIFRIKHGLFQHSQQYHTANPKLNSQQVSPLQKWYCQPYHTKYHINYAHHSIELEKEERNSYQNLFLINFGFFAVVEKIHVLKSNPFSPIGALGTNLNSSKLSFVYFKYHSPYLVQR